MADPFLGEIRMFGGNYAPVGWALCDGAIQSIAQNTALFSLLGTTYGGNGVTTYALPDLRGRLPIHQGQGPGLSSYTMGEVSGVESVTLTAAQMPLHTHPLQASAQPATTPDPGGAVLARAGLAQYSTVGTPVAMDPQAVVGAPGAGEAHTNLMPSTCVTFIICLQGIFPSRN